MSGDSAGDDALSPAGKGKRELSTSKRAAQNRAAQVGIYVLQTVSIDELMDRASELSASERKGTSRSWKSKSKSSRQWRPTSACFRARTISYGSTSSTCSRACSNRIAHSHPRRHTSICPPARQADKPMMQRHSFRERLSGNANANARSTTLAPLRLQAPSPRARSRSCSLPLRKLVRLTARMGDMQVRPNDRGSTKAMLLLKRRELVHSMAASMIDEALWSAHRVLWRRDLSEMRRRASDRIRGKLSAVGRVNNCMQRVFWLC